MMETSVTQPQPAKDRRPSKAPRRVIGLSPQLSGIELCTFAVAETIQAMSSAVAQTPALGSCGRRTGPDDAAALNAQMLELQTQLDARMAERLALQLLAEDMRSQSEICGRTTTATSSSCSEQGDDDIESDEAAMLLQLQELQARVGAMAAHAAFSCDVSTVAASCQLLREMARDEAIAAHDHKFAAEMHSTDDSTWDRKGHRMKSRLPIEIDPSEHPILRGCKRDDKAAGAAESMAGDFNTVQAAASCLKSYSKGMATYEVEALNCIVDRPADDVCAEVTAAALDLQQEAGGQLCSICFTFHADNDMISAGSEAAGSSSTRPGCGHLFCSACMRRYMFSCIDNNKHRVQCPSDGCKHAVSREDVLRLLKSSSSHMERYMRLDVESSIHPSERVYCPYKDCSALLLRPECKVEGPTLCPECERTLCAKCQITGWHEGYSCQQFQELPAHLRSADDVALLRLSQAQRWRKCPSCNHLVERTQGCNHMTCRCSTHFCYACGLRYLSDKPTANNVEGEPACKCELFTLPEDEQADEPDVPTVRSPQAEDLLRGIMLAAAEQRAHGSANGVRVRYRSVNSSGWLERGGRRVSRKQCRHALSIHDCPFGPDACWFSHPEDRV